MGASYVRKYFSPEAKIKTEEMVAMLKQEFLESVRRVSWMSEEVRSVALIHLQQYKYLLAR